MEPVTPPTSPAPPTGAPPKAVWPTVLGIVMMIFGVGGLLVGVWGIVGNLLLGDTIASLGSQGDPELAEAMRRQAPIGAALSLVMVGVAALLVVAAAGVLRRRPWAPRAATWWAVLKMVLAVASIVPALLMQRAQFEAMASQPGGPPEAFMFWVMVASLAVGVLWAWALPVFLLVWFRLGFVKREVATWRGAAA